MKNIILIEKLIKKLILHIISVIIKVDGLGKMQKQVGKKKKIFILKEDTPL